MKNSKRLTLVFAILAILFVFSACEKKNRLYFCEDYVDGKEVNESTKFSTGYLTVMVDLRPEGNKVGVKRIELILTKIKDENGDKISEKEVDRISFDVKPEWDYMYFQNEQKLGFREVGTYRVTMTKEDGTPVISGEVEVINNKVN